MAEIHVPYFEVPRIGQTLRDDTADDLINGRHLPYQPGFDVVKAVMARIWQTDYKSDYRVSEDIAQLPTVKEAVDRHIAETYADGFDGEVDYASEVASLWSLHGSFVRDVERTEAGLDRVKADFQERLIHASQNQNFPLGVEQIRDRLSHSSLGFKSAYQSEDSNGTYYPRLGMVLVNQGAVAANPAPGFANIHTVYHELLHPLGAKRFTYDDNEDVKMVVRRSGLMLPNDVRQWASEALTEIITCILLDERGTAVDFADKRPPSEVGNGIILEIMGAMPDLTIPDDSHSYTPEKIALLKTMSKVPFGKLVRAYCIQDLDPHEADQYAGSKAEKDLQRAIKVAGGADRIRELRLVDVAFAADNAQVALDVADGMYRKDTVLPRHLKFANQRAVARNSRKVRSGVKRAKKMAGCE